MISKDNGYGLTKDVKVLRSVLDQVGHDVHFTDWKKPRSVGRKFFHVNVFLELVNPAFFGQAERNYLIPNPDWFIDDWKRHLPAFDLILAKTRDCERIFAGLAQPPQPAYPVKYIGFTSEDRYDQFRGAVTHTDVLHLVGDSIYKGTDKVIEAAKRLHEVKFTVIGKNAPKQVPPNVTVIRKATDELVAAYQNTAIHCQPSTYEGFGHAINEARSFGALVITTAAAPMDELITEGFGFGAECCSATRERLAVHKHVCLDSLVEMIQIAVECRDTGEAQLAMERARQAFLDGREEFRRNITELLAA